MTYQDFVTQYETFTDLIFEFDKHTFEKWHSYLQQQNDLSKKYPKHYKKYRDSFPKMTLDKFIQIMKK